MELKFKPSEQVPGSFEANLNMTLVAIGTTDQVNKNKNVYRIATVKLENGKVVTAIIYAGNLAHGVEAGVKYLGKAIQDPSRGGELLLTMSHLPAAERANISDFEISYVETDELAAIAKEAKLEKVK